MVEKQTTPKELLKLLGMGLLAWAGYKVITQNKTPKKALEEVVEATSSKVKKSTKKASHILEKGSEEAKKRMSELGKLSAAKRAKKKAAKKKTKKKVAKKQRKKKSVKK